MYVKWPTSVVSLNVFGRKKVGKNFSLVILRGRKSEWNSSSRSTASPAIYFLEVNSFALNKNENSKPDAQAAAPVDESYFQL